MLFTTRGKLLVQKEEPPQAGKIITPETVSERVWMGRIVAVTPGQRTNANVCVMDIAEGEPSPENLFLAEGDLVHFERARAIEVKANGKEYLSLREEDVLVVERKPT